MSNLEDCFAVFHITLFAMDFSKKLKLCNTWQEKCQQAYWGVLAASIMPLFYLSSILILVGLISINSATDYCRCFAICCLITSVLQVVTFQKLSGLVVIPILTNFRIPYRLGIAIICILSFLLVMSSFVDYFPLFFLLSIALLLLKVAYLMSASHYLEIGKAIEEPNIQFWSLCIFWNNLLLLIIIPIMLFMAFATYATSFVSREFTQQEQWDTWLLFVLVIAFLGCSVLSYLSLFMTNLKIWLASNTSRS